MHSHRASTDSVRLNTGARSLHSLAPSLGLASLGRDTGARERRVYPFILDAPIRMLPFRSGGEGGRFAALVGVVGGAPDYFELELRLSLGLAVDGDHRHVSLVGDGDA